MELFGRFPELSAIEKLLAGARAGGGGALVFDGEPGAGKSALLEYAAAIAGMRTLRAAGVESESHLPFAAAHMLLGATLGQITSLPARQAEVAREAFGFGPPAGGDRFLTGLAGLGLLTGFAAGAPLLCLVDDAQWLDRQSADLLLFMIRRLGRDGVALIVATRAGEGAFGGPGIPALRLGGLADADAARLLRARAGELPAGVRDRVVAESRGNPLALLELAAQLGPEQRAGRVTPLPLHVSAGSRPVASPVQTAYWERVRRLPEPTRTALLVAAADDGGDLGVVLRAAGRLGPTLDHLAVAERDGLVTIAGPALAFRHPLLRTAIYRFAPASERVAAHRALAAAYSDPAQVDQRAWHRAAATLGPDPEAAASLVAVAERAALRGEHAEASAAYARAAEMSAERRTRFRLLAAAAEAARDAGRPDQAIALAGRAEAAAGDEDDDPAGIARLARVRADAEGEPARAARTLTAAAARVRDRDPVAAQPLLAEAAWHAWYAGEVLPAPADGLPPDPAGTALLYAVTGDEETAWARATAVVAELRGARRFGRLPVALVALAAAGLFRGDHPAASAAAAECVHLAGEIGQPRRGALGTAVLALLAAIGGAEQRCAALVEELAPHGPLAALGSWAAGLLDLGLGRYAAAARRLGSGPSAEALAPFLPALVAPDLVEAAVRAGRPEPAVEAIARFAGWVSEWGRPWSEAVLLRCRALVAEGPAAEDLYRAATALHAHGGRPFERARTALLYGEWLRRARRRAEARIPLSAALETFDRMAAAPWAARARSELAALGEPAGPGLTSQELRIVRLAAGRLTNRDIAALLFLSPRTVEFHLYRAYRKLGVSARGELAQLDLD